MDPEHVAHFFDELKILVSENRPAQQKADILFQLLAYIFLDITKRERLYFSTLFARIAFVGDKWNLDKKVLYLIHKFRREYQQTKRNEAENFDQVVDLGIYAVVNSATILYNLNVPEDLLPYIPKPASFKVEESYKVQSYYPSLRVIIMQIDHEQSFMLGISENNPDLEIKILINISGRNEIFNENITELIAIEALPISMNLLQVEVDDQDNFRPASIIIEPDFLLDVTSIAECFKPYGTESIGYLFKKYLPKESSVPLLTGNIANYFLDELITNPVITFKTLFTKVFDLYPLDFAKLDDDLLLKFMKDCKNHFYNLKNAINTLFPSVNIKVKNSILEPSFFSEKYGLQGRLDLFEKTFDQPNVNIVELKSGKTYLPNAYKINHSHYIQTLLYDLIVQSVFQKVNVSNYILYSKNSEDPLRHAPVLKSQQKEALFIRNKLLLMEKGLIILDPRSLHNKFSKIHSSQFPKSKGFDKKDLDRFHKIYTELNGIEKALWIYYTRFIATEHHLAKIGQQGSERSHGLASLWLSDLAKKEEAFEIFSQLHIQKIETSETDAPKLILAKSEFTNKLANYRIGDIVILYPHTGLNDAVLRNQVYKCIILDLDDQLIHIRLRNKQINTELFNRHELWNLEKDILDSSFRSLYRGLFRFANLEPAKRALIMGLRSPDPPHNNTPDLSSYEELTNEQLEVLHKILVAKDYFLLWGPPGTGKTSVMLRSLVRYTIDNTNKKVLLLAYTNRAVDEICSSIESIRPDIVDSYFRIGSSYSTHPKFKPRLLQSKMDRINKRSELMEYLGTQRIVVGTVASVQGKMDLLDLIKFDIAIVDEASQILDPQLMGFLPRFEKFILIGDHQQLPAVVTQNEEQSAISNPALNEIGYHNMRDSLFERLYKRCNIMGWDWAFDILTIQGRMHKDLMKFPSNQFYNGLLKVFPDNKNLIRDLKLIPTEGDNFSRILSENRLIYIPTPVDNQQHTKTNSYEAEWVLKVINSIEDLYVNNQLKINSDTIGVITPYRAQIALIRDMLADHAMDPNKFSIDTVERYQGGARDIIIFSLCTNYFRQLSTMISLSKEGVDRKLNVALTRAKSQIVLIGNEKILSQNEIYNNLLKSVFRLDIN